MYKMSIYPESALALKDVLSFVPMFAGRPPLVQ